MYSDYFNVKYNYIETTLLWIHHNDISKNEIGQERNPANFNQSLNNTRLPHKAVTPHIRP